MKILAGLSHKKLAQDLATQLNCHYVETDTTTFADGETRVQIQQDMNGCDVIIVQSTSRPANNHLMELLLLIDTVKRAGAKSITAVMPYFGYSRQDRRSYIFSPISARLVANLLETAGITKLITIDLHSPILEGFFAVPVQNLSPISLFTSIINRKNQEDKNTLIVSPDVGGVLRLKKIHNLLKMEIAVINKSRNSNNQHLTSDIIGNVQGKHCLLIDDIVDSGQTLCTGAKLLQERGALSIEAFITHPVLSGSAIEELNNSNIENIYITDTIETTNLPAKFQVISILPIIIEALKK